MRRRRRQTHIRRACKRSTGAHQDDLECFAVRSSPRTTTAICLVHRHDINHCNPWRSGRCLESLLNLYVSLVSADWSPRSQYVLLCWLYPYCRRCQITYAFAFSQTNLPRTENVLHMTYTRLPLNVNTYVIQWHSRATDATIVNPYM